MEKAQTKKHEARYKALCEEMRRWLYNTPRKLALDIEDNVKARAAFYLLDEIRALQQSGFDADKIVDALIEKAESRLKPVCAAGEISI